MKLTAKIELRPTPEQANSLAATLYRANECANWVSSQAWTHQQFRHYALHKIVYREARERFSLSAQVAVSVIGKVSDAYLLDQKRQRKFGKTGAIAYDDRILSFREGAVSIWLLGGRQAVSYVAGPRQIALLAARQGESDLLYHRGKWFLAVTCNAVEPTVQQVDDWLGIDLGVANIATDSDGGNFSGSGIRNVRHRHRSLRTKLQKKETRGARRKLRELSGRENRFASDTNHCIAKKIIACAKGTGRGVAIEDLKGISTRITVRRNQRAVLRSWAFEQLRTFIIYKARLAGVPVVTVDPRNTSRECSECGHIDKRNRPSQSKFRCLACEFEANADFNAACNIRGRAFASRPNVAQKLAATS